MVEFASSLSSRLLEGQVTHGWLGTVRDVEAESTVYAIVNCTIVEEKPRA